MASETVGTRWRSILRGWIIPFGLELAAVLLIVKFVCFFAWVPSGSMLPTIAEHSVLFSTRIHNPEQTVQRGDIIVFRSDELDLTLIKRCVGLPGDHILVSEEGKLFVNGVYYPEPYVVFPEEGAGEFAVPQGEYLFFGDNRADSTDARYWENPYVPAEQLMGRARFTLWPLTNFGVLR